MQHRRWIRAVAAACVALAASPDSPRAENRAPGELPPALLAVSRSAHELVVIDPASLEVHRRIGIGTGSHEVAADATGAVALTASLGIFPVPHEQAIAPSEMGWMERPSTGYDRVSLPAGRREARTLENCRRPHGLAMTPDGTRAWVTCEDAGTILEIYPGGGNIVRSLEVEEGVHKVMHLPDVGLLAASNPDTGAVYIVDTDTGSIRRLETGQGAEALAASPDGAAVWVANSFDATLCRIDARVATLDGCWPTGGRFPIALAVDEPRRLVWVARSFSADLAAFSIAERAVVREIDLPSNPLGMALDARRGRLYLTLPRRNEIVVVATDTGEVVGRIGGVMEADDLDLVPAAAFDSPPDT